MTNDLTSKTPAEIDTLWVEILAKAAQPRAELRMTRKSIGRYDRARWAIPEYLTEREAALVEKIAEIETEAAPFQLEYERRGGWVRYIKCESDGGHVHFQECHTLHPFKTVVSWLPSLSGLTSDEIVEELGFAACTFCFPTAPTFAKYQREAAEAAAVAEAKDAAKCSGSGKYVRGGHGRRYVTCPDCGGYFSVTSTGLLRSHKAPKEAAS